MVLLVVLGQVRRFSGLFEGFSAYLQSESGIAQLESIEAGDTFEEFAVTGVDGRRHASRELITERTLVLFLSADCAPCVELLTELRPIQGVVDGIPLVIISTNSNPMDQHKQEQDIEVFVDTDRQAMSAFSNKVAPRAFLVEADGLVLDKGIANSIGQLRAMVRRSGVAESSRI
ncbi:MAG: hypothetical protein H0U54_08245 [Acidobacteria bacterium]|nr:hypothetical protein [Acidobacteriota bacterium]